MIIAAAVSKLLQSCLTLCNPIDSSPQGSPVPGILQARTLEWVAISFSNAWKQKVKVKSWQQWSLVMVNKWYFNMSNIDFLLIEKYISLNLEFHINITHTRILSLHMGVIILIIFTNHPNTENRRKKID